MLALYGSLLRSLPQQRRLGFAKGLKLVGPCTIPGALYDLGRYPGLVAGEGRVRGELYRLRDAMTLARLDRFEGVALDPALFRRIRIRLIQPATEAWVYCYARPVLGRPRVRSGCWLEHARGLLLQARQV
jgi:gamma-glutamylcyclotransferase (GGCT)/AIG2-like uncharacterized protein YtfP